MVETLIPTGTSSAKRIMPHMLVTDDLFAVESILDNALAPFCTDFGQLVQHLKHYRGKRLRPMLVLLAGHACGRVTHAHHVLGAVVEMIHTATLVHDDILDESTVRRHVRTINSAWGNKSALLLGDMLFSAAFHLCASVDVQACRWIGDATNRVCAGELLQVSRAGDLSLSETDYFKIVEGKTGALTECCTRLAAHYSGATPDTVKDLGEFGRNLGIAFQIADDVLDLKGDSTVAGKTLGTDVEQGKMTLPVIRCLANLAPTEAERLRRAIREGSRGAVHRMLVESGTLSDVRRDAIRFSTLARRSLAPLSHSPYRTALEELADWSIRRDR